MGVCGLIRKITSQRIPSSGRTSFSSAAAEQIYDILWSQVEENMDGNAPEFDEETSELHLHEASNDDFQGVFPIGLERKLHQVLEERLEKDKRARISSGLCNATT